MEQIYQSQNDPVKLFEGNNKPIMRRIYGYVDPSVYDELSDYESVEVTPELLEQAWKARDGRVAHRLAEEVKNRLDPRRIFDVEERAWGKVMYFLYRVFRPRRIE